MFLQLLTSPCCGAPVSWHSPAALTGRCTTCCLCVRKRPRALPRPALPDHTSVGWLPHLDALNLAPISPADYRYTTVRHHPAAPDVAVVCRYDTPIAIIHVRVARWLRYQWLHHMAQHHSYLAVHEGDVVVHILHALLQSASAPAQHFDPTASHVPDRHPGDSHQFMVWDDYSQPGSSFPASLPSTTSSGGIGCPSSSAFTPLASLPFPPSPLNRTAYATIFDGDPLLPYFCNGVRYGFSLGAHGVPASPRPPRADALHADQPSIDTISVELDAGACVPTSLLAPDTPLRFAPWYAVVKNSGGFRGVGDLSWGPDSVNAYCTRPLALLGRPLLAQWSPIAERMCWMSTARPGVSIVLFKLDASRAYRTLGVPARDLHLQCHLVGDHSVCSVRSEMGAVASGDHCCAVSSSIEAVAAASPRRLFCSSYVDDQLALSWADTAADDLAYLRGLWLALGWTLNDKKFLLEGGISQQITFLGVHLDSASFTASVTRERRDALLAQLDALLPPELGPSTPDFLTSLSSTATAAPVPPTSAVSITHRTLASLVGKLTFCASIVPMGRAFLRSLQRASGSLASYGHSPSRGSASVLLDSASITDLRFWQWYLRDQPGVAHFGPLPPGPTVHAGTDASKHGWGGICEELSLFTAGRWTSAERRGSSTAHWEALAAVMLTATLAPWATGGTLFLACDSSASVAALSASRARDPQMHALCQLFAVVQILACVRVHIYHYPGRLNTLPDLLSRGVPASRLPLPRASRLRRLDIPHLIRWCGILAPVPSPSPPSPAPQPATPPSTPGGRTARTSVFRAPKDTPWVWPLWQRRPTTPSTLTASTGSLT